MKKYYFAAVAALFCVLSCNKAELQPVSGDAQLAGNTYSFTFAASQADSKLTLGDLSEGTYPLKWQVGDVLQVYEIGEGSTRTWKCATDSLKAVNPDGSATFSFTIDAEPGTRVRLQQNNNMTSTKAYGNSILQYSQTYSGTGVGNLAELRNYDLNFIDRELKVGTPDASAATFLRPLAMVRIPFSSTVFAGWKVDKVIIARADSAQMAGQFTFNGATSAEKSFLSTSTNQACDFVEVKYSNPVTITTEEQNVFALTFPTYKYVSGQATPAVTYKVGFQISKGGERKFLSAKFSACLVSGKVTPLNFGTMLSSDEDNDYYSQFKFGADLKIGDLVVNKRTHPKASSVALSDVNYAMMKKEGVYFIDNIACDSLDLHTNFATNQGVSAAGKSVVLIGRYNQSGKQIRLNVVEMRTFGDIAFMNLTLAVSKYSVTKSPQFLFSKQSTDQNATALRLQDCVIDGAICTSAVIGDRNGSSTDAFSGPYSNIYLDNCVAFLPVLNSSTGSALSFYRHYKFFAASGQTDIPRSITLNNNEFIWACSIVSDNANLINLMNSGDDGSSPSLKLAITNNNLINCSPASVIRFKAATSAASDSYYDRNIMYIANSTLFNYTQAKVFYCGTSGEKLGTAKDNYASADKCYKKTDLTKQVTFSMYSTVSTNAKLVVDVNPFSTLNLSTGYVVVDASNAEISSRSAGATPKTFVAQ